MLRLWVPTQQDKDEIPCVNIVLVQGGCISTNTLLIQSRTAEIDQYAQLLKLLLPTQIQLFFLKMPLHIFLAHDIIQLPP